MSLITCLKSYAYIWELDRLKGGESGSIPATSGAAVGLQWDKSYFHKFATWSGLGKVFWESYKNDSGYSENMTIEHHNSSKYLHWCTGLACGNLLFPPIWYFAILHGGWLWKQRCFHIFHTTKWHPSDKPGMRERKKYLSLHWCHDATMQWQFTFNSWTLSLSESSRHLFQNILTELTRNECIWYGYQLTEFAARRAAAAALLCWRGAELAASNYIVKMPILLFLPLSLYVQ